MLPYAEALTQINARVTLSLVLRTHYLILFFSNTLRYTLLQQRI